MLTLYNVVSADGFIASTSGEEDFIPESYWKFTLEILKKYDCIILGRKTYEAIQNYEEEFRETFDRLPAIKFVITTNKNFQVKEGYNLAHTSEEVIQSNMNIVVTSGHILNDYLLSKNLVDKIMYHEVPVPIFNGIKPYYVSPDKRVKIKTRICL